MQRDFSKCKKDPLFEMFTGHSSYSFGFNNPVLFGDPSGMAPEKHKSGGGDVLLGSSGLGSFLGAYSNSVVAFVSYYVTIPYVESYVGYSDDEDEI